MDDSRRFCGPQFRADEPEEYEAVCTTIVGGRPPGSGQPVGAIPRGIELLMKKAAVDPEFRTLLVERRAEAASQIGLQLDPAESLMLAVVPQTQLETIIDRTTVPLEHRRAFLGKTVAAMLAAVGVLTPGDATAAFGGCGGIRPDARGEIGSFGVRPDLPDKGAGQIPDAQHPILAKIRAVLADVLERDPATIHFDTKPKADLEMTDDQIRAVRQSLKEAFLVPIPYHAFLQSETVGEWVDHVERAQEVQQVVADVLRKQLKLEDNVAITDKTCLHDKLKITPAQLGAVRRDLSRQLRIHLDWKEFRQKETVGQLVAMAADLVRLRQQNADKPDPASEQDAHPNAVPYYLQPGLQPGMPSQRLPSQTVRPVQPPPSPCGGIRP